MTDVTLHTRYRLTRVINAAGTMTTLGASIVVPEAISAAAAIEKHFVRMSELQARASEAIAKATGAEAGYVTACSAAGISLAVAASMTGCNLARIERLPDSGGLNDEIVIQSGHRINYGAPIDQAIRLAGARVVAAGSAAVVEPYHLEDAITSRTAAVLHVVSHHTVQEGPLPLVEVIAIARARGVPVIVDMASEYDLNGPIAMGAGLAIYSAHKFLGGLTAGIVAGNKDLVRSCYLQNRGIGRSMKVGKESVLATIAALDAWQARDHSAARQRELAIVANWEAMLAGVPGVTCNRHADWTGNPIDRLELSIGSDAGLFAWELADRLAAGDPAICIRDDLAEQGLLYLDPCNIQADDAASVGAAIRSHIDSARRLRDGHRISWQERRSLALQSILRWPD